MQSSVVSELIVNGGCCILQILLSQLYNKAFKLNNCIGINECFKLAEKHARLIACKNCKLCQRPTCTNPGEIITVFEITFIDNYFLILLVKRLCGYNFDPDHI